MVWPQHCPRNIQDTWLTCSIMAVAGHPGRDRSLVNVFEARADNIWTILIFTNYLDSTWHIWLSQAALLDTYFKQGLIRIQAFLNSIIAQIKCCNQDNVLLVCRVNPLTNHNEELNESFKAHWAPMSIENARPVSTNRRGSRATALCVRGE